MITLALITSRRENLIGMTFETIGRQVGNEPIQFIVVDRYAEDEGRREWLKMELAQSGAQFSVQHVSPKPSPWSGPHRLTREEFFTPSNYRNTAICYAKGESIIFLDDLTAAAYLWFETAKQILGSWGVIGLGAYRKVKRLRLEGDGVIKFDDHPSGHDSRWSYGKDDTGVPSPPGFLFGCSIAAPLEAFLEINGWDERCDAMGLGSEDTMAGLMLARRGLTLIYDRRMLTYESEEHHHIEPPMKRVIQTAEGREDASWEMLRMVRDTNCDYAPNYFPEGGIRAMRQHILRGGEWSTAVSPEHDWYSKRLLSEI